jgi:hypothetical protein
MSQTDSNKNLIVSLPIQTKLTIDRLFQSEYSQLHLDKIYFLIHKINKEGQYQINAKNHAWFFGLKCGEVTAILRRLTNNNIITLVGEYVQGKASNKYSLAQPFDIRTNNLHRINYYAGQVKFPTWVTKFVADGGVVKNGTTTNWVKDEKEVKEKKHSVSNDSKILIEQQGIIIKEQSTKIVELIGEIKRLTSNSNLQFEPQMKPVETSTQSTASTTSDLKITARNGVELILTDGQRFDDSTIELIKKHYSKSAPLIAFAGNYFTVDKENIVTRKIFKAA